VPLTLAGSPLLRHTDSSNATHHVRRFLTPLLGIPLATEEMEEEDHQGTLTLWFHKNKNENGNVSDKVYGVSNCHILRKNPTVDYNHAVGSPMEHVRVCGMHQFQRCLNEITEAIADHCAIAELWTRDIARLRAKEKQDAANAKAIMDKGDLLEKEIVAVANLVGIIDGSMGK